MPNATTNLAVLVADTSFVTSLTEAVIAEQRSSAVQLVPVVAATTAFHPTIGIVIGEYRETDSALDVLLSGSSYLLGSMSLGVAEPLSVFADADVAIAELYSLTPGLEVLITDSIAIVLEPNAPKAAPFLTSTDLLLGTHPNVFTSPTVDFEGQGVRAGDVLEVYDGPNAAHYIIQSVDGNAVFVGEAPISPSDTTPRSGEVRTHRDKIAQVTAAVVLDQALFFAPTVRTALLDMVVSA